MGSALPGVSAPERQGAWNAAMMLVLTLTLASTIVSGAWAEAAPVRHPSALSAAPERPPNILVIFSDDVGYWNVSAYSRGMMGHRTPNIDRIAKEGSALHRLLRRADIHRGTDGISDGAICRPCRPAKGTAPGGYPGFVGQGCDACAIAQVSRLPHRPIRPVSPRGSQRVFAHGAGLGRIPRQLLCLANSF